MLSLYIWYYIQTYVFVNNNLVEIYIEDTSATKLFVVVFFLNNLKQPMIFRVIPLSTPNVLR